MAAAAAVAAPRAVPLKRLTTTTRWLAWKAKRAVLHCHARRFGSRGVDAEKRMAEIEAEQLAEAKEIEKAAAEVKQAKRTCVVVAAVRLPTLDRGFSAFFFFFFFADGARKKAVAARERKKVAANANKVLACGVLTAAVHTNRSRGGSANNFFESNHSIVSFFVRASIYQHHCIVVSVILALDPRNICQLF